VNYVDKQKKIVIIGAGPGGLTAAMLLASQGYHVDIFEKADRVGGRNASLTLGEFTFDIGPTFLMMKSVLDNIFLNTGRNLEDYVTIHKLDLMYRLKFSEKDVYMHADREKLKDEISRKFPGNEKGYEEFLRFEESRYQKLYPFLQKDYSKASAFFTKESIKNIPVLSLNKSLYQVLSQYFSHEELRLSFTFQAKYLGMSPWSCPGAYVMIPYVEHAQGIFHVEGGLSQISQAMAKVVREEGGQIHLNTQVSSLIIQGKAVKGVILEDGERVHADRVVVNADFAYAMSNLVEQGTLKKYSRARLQKKAYSCSTFMLYLGLDKLYDIPHHNIIFPINYKENMDNIFTNHKVSDDFALYIQNPSLLDPTLAPKGKSALYILVPVANNLSAVDWDAEKGPFRDLVLKAVASRTELKDIANHINEEKIITPKDWERSYNVYQGAVFSLSHALNQMLYFRPHNRFEELKNLYLVGGGTHPGSGLPTIYESANISTRLIEESFGIKHTIPEQIKPRTTIRA
jgi:phytoene desaturase